MDLNFLFLGGPYRDMTHSSERAPMAFVVPLPDSKGFAWYTLRRPDIDRLGYIDYWGLQFYLCDYMGIAVDSHVPPNSTMPGIIFVMDTLFVPVCSLREMSPSGG